MNKHQKQKLESILESLSKKDRDRVYDLAREQRSAAQKRRRSKARETMDGERVGGRRRADPLIDWVLRIVEKEYGHAKKVRERSDDDSSTMREGVVIELTRRRATVLADGEASDDDEVGGVHCRLSAELASRQQSGIAVGDRVVFDRIELQGEDDQYEVLSVLERRSKLARPDAHDPRVERVVAANVDVVVIVVSVVSPPLHPRLIDRYLVAIESGECEAVIAVNKVDLLGDPDSEEYAEELSKLDPYREAGIPIAICAAVPDGGRGGDSGKEGVDRTASRVGELRGLLSGKTCAFVGHSGVGKSSLANALDPALGLETGRVRERDARGRHTTTSSSMHFIDGVEGGQIRVIDTPGVRFFGLADVTPEELRWMFPEFVEYTHDCKFNDCSHEHEPACAVRDAVDSGTISSVRYETYVRLLEELRTGGKPKDVSERIRPRLDELDGEVGPV